MYLYVLYTKQCLNGSYLKCTLLCIGCRSVSDTDVQRPEKTVFFLCILTASGQKSIWQINTDLSDPIFDLTDVCMMHTSAQIFFYCFSMEKSHVER